MIRIKSNKNSLVLLVVFLLMLLGVREAFSSAAELPELNTLSAQKRLVGTAEAGQSFKVLDLFSFPSGERFAQVDTGNEKAWLQLSKDQNPRIGELLDLAAPAYLFSEPVVEESEGRVEDLGAAPSSLRSRHPLNPRALGVNQSCTNFIRSDGNFGDWGAFLMGKLSRGQHPSFFSGALRDLGTVCPRFGKMSDDERKNFWVWLIASMANFESSCNPSVKAKGVNGTAAGLLQLHLGKEHVYGCRKGINSLNARHNLECGLTILNNDMKRTGKIFPSGRNYWEVLRPQTRPGQRTLKVAKQYKPCF